MRLLLILALAGLILSACKSGQKEDRTAVSVLTEDETEALEESIEQIKKVYHLCPSPAEMLSIIDVSELDYLGEELNPPENQDLYFDMKTQTLNLGVYITDLAYTALFGRHQETLEYLAAVQTMSEEVRVTGAVNDDLIDRARNNVEYLDSLFNISNEAFINMLYYCEKNNRPNTIVLLSAGAFIESLYLAINMVDDYDEAEMVISHLAEQKYALDNLVAFAETLQEDENIITLLDEIQPIRDIYDQLGSEAGETTVEKESDNKLVIGGGNKVILNEEDFNQLKEETFTLRKRITGNSES